MFISLDGIDGAGKSTQIGLLRDWLVQRGHDVVSFRDPGATALGESIRDILLHREEIPLSMTSEMLLYMAARAQLVREQIEPALSNGNTVLCDRYLLSNVVYQGSAGGLDIESLWQVGAVATGNRKPDVTIVLDLDAELALKRVGSSQDRLEKRGIQYFQAVRQGFIEQWERSSEHGLVVDATQSPEQVHEQIVQFLMALV